MFSRDLGDLERGTQKTQFFLVLVSVLWGRGNMNEGKSIDSPAHQMTLQANSGVTEHSTDGFPFRTSQAVPPGFAFREYEWLSEGASRKKDEPNTLQGVAICQGHLTKVSYINVRAKS